MKDAHEALLREGDVLLIPPGWWYSVAGVESVALATKSYVNEAQKLVPYVLVPAGYDSGGMGLVTTSSTG